MTKALRCILAWLALLPSLPVAGSTLELADTATSAGLSPHLAYRHDASLSDRPGDAWRRVDRGEFAPLPGGKDAFGFQSGAFWFHATIVNRNAGEQRWLLVQEYAALYGLRAVITRNAANSRIAISRQVGVSGRSLLNFNISSMSSPALRARRKSPLKPLAPSSTTFCWARSMDAL